VKSLFRILGLLGLVLAPDAGLRGRSRGHGPAAVTVTTAPGGGQTYSLTLQVLILMTVLSLLPAILLMMTAFTRIVIVLAILRQAIGAGQTPPNQVLVGLALFLTFFVMSPVIEKVNTEAAQPYLAGTIETTVRSSAPSCRSRDSCSSRRARPTSRRSCASRAARLRKPSDVPLSILVPAVRHERAQDGLPDRIPAVHSRS
jgi:flagellar biosynthetic protein FliP